MNPLFPDDDEDKQKQRAKNDAGYVVSNRHGRTLQPIHHDLKPSHTAKTTHSGAFIKPDATEEQKLGQSTPAVELIRRKLESLYSDEPDATEEVAEVAAEPVATMSKHQKFMQELSTSGKSLATIQTEWHAYYVALPDNEKQEVWQEFYTNNSRSPSAYTQHVNRQKKLAEKQHAENSMASATAAHHTQPHKPSVITPEASVVSSTDKARSAVLAAVSEAEEPEPTSIKDLLPDETDSMVVVAEHVPSEMISRKTTPADKRSVQAIRKHIAKKVNLEAKVPAKARQHLRSLAFGLSTGALVLLVVLFSFFNEVVIAPFIQPSRHVSATPIILSSTDVAPTSTPEVIIPKIDVEIPVDYSQTSNNENDIENALENGIVHYPSTALPGQQGNAAFFGHSSNNIFNPGKYKFAFVLLHELVPGDVFYLTYGSKVYTYKVFDKQIVDPGDVSVLNNVAGKTATATLITCDPPGTSLHRLVVWGEQISPDPTANTAAAATANTTQSQPAKLAGNGPTLWKRLTNWLF